jgi:hypothetical protein
MADKELRINLTGDSKDLEKALSSAQQKLVAFSGKMKDIGQTLSLTLTAPLALAGTAAVKMASDFDESLNKVDVAFKTSSAEVQAFAKTTMQSFGIAEGSALEMASLFGDMATSMGLTTAQSAKLSTSLVGLAGDLSSFKNIGIADATTALNGIFTGETESLKRLGVVMTEANLKTFALTQGLKANFELMSQGEKVLLRYNYVMNATKNAQGDFARTQGGAANQMRMFSEGLKQLGVQFGQIVLPAVTKVVTALNGFIKYIGNADSGTKSFILVLAGIAAASGPLLFLAGTIIPKVIIGINLMTAAATRFNLTVGKGSALFGLVTLLGYAAIAAKDYADALNPNNKLTEQEKSDAQAIRNKNKEILKSIAILKQQKQIAEAPITGLNAGAGLSPKTIDQQIAGQYKLIQQNNALIKSIEAVKKVSETSPIANFDVSEIASGTQKEVYGILGDLISLGEKIDEHRQKTRELKNELLAIKWPDLGKPLDSLTYGINKALEAFKTPMSVMNQQIAENTKIQQENLAALSLSYTQAVDHASGMADGVSNAFGFLANSIVQSFGTAQNGLNGFLQGMARTALQLGQMILKEIIMNKALATSNAIAGATKSGAATGPAAVFTTPAFIATAVGGVLSAFAAIPKFAAGGIVSGPTMGLMGEYPGAKSNPEVIAPLSKLQGMIDTGSGGNMNLTGEFVVRGSDLVLALQRAEKQKSRIG